MSKSTNQKTDMTDIIIIIRDCNGRRERHDFEKPQDAYELAYWLENEEDSEDNYELLFVGHDGCCVYTGINNEPAPTWEDLMSYFA